MVVYHMIISICWAEHASSQKEIKCKTLKQGVTGLSPGPPSTKEKVLADRLFRLLSQRYTIFSVKSLYWNQDHCSCIRNLERVKVCKRYFLLRIMVDDLSHFLLVGAWVNQVRDIWQWCYIRVCRKLLFFNDQSWIVVLSKLFILPIY